MGRIEEGIWSKLNKLKRCRGEVVGRKMGNTRGRTSLSTLVGALGFELKTLQVCCKVW